jgi:hypothetical protein
MSSFSANDMFQELSNYVIGREKFNRVNSKLKDAAISNNQVLYQKFIMAGYNPYRKDNNGKLPFEYSDDPNKFFKISNDWLSVLAYDSNPDLMTCEDDVNDED